MINKEMIKKYANQLMFDLNDTEIEEVVEEFQVLKKQLEKLNDVDTTDVVPMVYPFDVVTTYLREDDVTEVISQKEALSLVSKSKNGHFCVPKVVK